jgi:sugar/nucleoside kinase (ribokinase family)
MQEQTRTCGGQIATALATCASLGLRATYLGAIGDDEDGRRIRGELVARGIDLGHVEVTTAPTATATILLDATGDRIVLWHRDRLRYRRTACPWKSCCLRVLHVDDVDARGHRGGPIAGVHGIPSRATSITSRPARGNSRSW